MLDICGITVSRTKLHRYDDIRQNGKENRTNAGLIRFLLSGRYAAGRAAFAVAAGIFMLAVISFLSVSMVMANDKPSSYKTSNKYYTSIDIKKNDTLWGIAQQYAQEGSDIAEYIKDIKSINRLSDNNITQGQHLVVYYYSDEIK